MLRNLIFLYFCWILPLFVWWSLKFWQKSRAVYNNTIKNAAKTAQPEIRVAASRHHPWQQLRKRHQWGHPRNQTPKDRRKCKLHRSAGQGNPEVFEDRGEFKLIAEGERFLHIWEEGTGRDENHRSFCSLLQEEINERRGESLSSSAEITQ